MPYRCPCCGQPLPATTGISPIVRQAGPLPPPRRLAPATAPPPVLLPMMVVAREPPAGPPYEAICTDHAIARLFQYQRGVDRETLANEILTPAVRNAIAAGVAVIKRPDGLRLRIRFEGKVGKVVTVQPKERPPKRMPVRAGPKRPPPVEKELREYFEEMAEGLVE